MADSKAYKLPDKEKYPELYKKTGGLFSKNTTKFANAIEKYVSSHFAPKNAEKMQMFLNSQGKSNLKPEQIKKNLAELCSKSNVREAEFIMALQGEELGKKDLMLPTSHDKASIAFTALRTGQFDIVEQILTEEGTSLCVKDVIDDFKNTGKEKTYSSTNDILDEFMFDNSMQDKHKNNKHLEYLGKLLISPVFKDTSENIEEMWKQLPDKYKKAAKNKQAYQIAINKHTKSKAQIAAQALNKGNIAAMKKTKAVER